MFDGELIEGFVGIERLDDPVAVGPDAAVVVDVNAVGVSVTGGVQPIPRLVLAVSGGGQKAIDGLLIGVGTGVGEECVDVPGSGRQAC